MKHLALVLLAGCTSLGPMPSTTAVSAVPAGRPGVEITGASLPAFRLSDATRDAERDGYSVPALAALLELDRLLELPGVILGGRAFGKEGDTGIEPFVGYRKRLGRTSIAGVGFGTRMSASENGASYSATRIGGEVIADVELVRLTSWASIHTSGALQATFIDAKGRYCADPDGNGTDCAEDGSVPFVDGSIEGIYSAATLQASLDVGRRPAGIFHSARLAGMVSLGHMPRLVGGRQEWGDPYIAGGILLSFGVGAR